MAVMASPGARGEVLSRVRSTDPGRRSPAPGRDRSPPPGGPSPRTRSPAMRRTLTLVVCLAVGLGAVVTRPVAAADSKAPATTSQFLKIRTPGAPTIMPDGSLLVRDWPDGVYQLYRVTPKTT